MNPLFLNICRSCRKGSILEKALISKGEIKTYNKTQNSQGISNNKKKYWVRNKNVTNNEVGNTKAIHTSLTLTLKGPNMPNNPPQQIENSFQNTQGKIPQRQFLARHKYTPLGEPIESILKQLLQSKVITLLEMKLYDLGHFKASWWD